MEVRSEWQARHAEVARAARNTWIVGWSGQLRCDFRRLMTVAERALGTRERIAVAPLAEGAPWWESELSALPAENVAEQPCDRGTAPAILLAFLRIFRRHPFSQIVLMPAGGSFEEDGRLERVLELARDVQLRDPGRIMLVSPPSAQGSRRSRVLSASREGVSVASTPALLRLFQRTQPELLSVFLEHLAGPALFDRRVVEQLYPCLPLLDFGRDVLALEPDLVQLTDLSGARTQPADPWTDPAIELSTMTPVGSVGRPEYVRRAVSVTS